MVELGRSLGLWKPSAFYQISVTGISVLFQCSLPRGPRSCAVVFIPVGAELVPSSVFAVV